MSARIITSNSIFATFAERVKEHPDKAALVFLGKTWSYSDLKDKSERLASGFLKLGINPGDKVIVYLPNIPQNVIAWLALQRVRAIPVVISPIYTAVDFKYMANDTKATMAICMDTNFGYVMRVIPDTSIKKTIVCTTGGMLPWWKRMMGKAFDRVPEGKFALSEDVHALEKIMGESTSSLPPLNGNVSEEIASILYTGGTMGLPKGVPISNIAFQMNALQSRESFAGLVPLGTGVQYQAAPLFHVLGQMSGIGACLSIAGDTMILAPRVNLDAQFDHIQRYKVNLMFGVPSLYRMILDHDRVDYYDLSSLKFCMIGGDAVPFEIMDRWKRKFKKDLYQGYGITEASGTISICRPEETSPLGSLGRQLAMQQIMTVDPETLQPVPAGEPGELLVRSDHMVKAYWNKPEESAEAFVTINNQLWYRSKDIIRVDKDGFMYFLDRSADMIKHKGYRVAASEIERTLMENPAVIAACVVGVPDPGVGERIKAFVVLKEDVRGVTGYDLITWCRQRLAQYKIPQYIEFRDVLPKSKVGKLLRRELRAEERKKMEKSTI
jgi:long-chain acyl-CoA synthetase